MRNRLADLTGPLINTTKFQKAAHVYFVTPDGKADSPGTTLEQPTTLESAIERAVTGDAVILRGGIYRTGGLVLNQGITLQPYGDEATGAERDPGLPPSGRHCVTMCGGLPGSSCSLLRLWAGGRRSREGMRTPLHRFNNDMVFVDGEFLKSAGVGGRA